MAMLPFLFSLIDTLFGWWHYVILGVEYTP